jgi:hypothetical protein
MRYDSGGQQSGWHPLSKIHFAGIETAGASLQAQLLSLAVAIEAAVKQGLPHAVALSQSERAELEEAVERIQMCDLTSGMKSRIGGALSGWSHGRGMSSVLRDLQRREVVSESEVDAWQRVRHPAAHGDAHAGRPVELMVEDLHALVGMLYRVCFETIGYRGPYRCYSERGFPLMTFAPTDAR